MSRICFGLRKYVGLPNHRVPPTTRVSSCPSAGSPCTTRITKGGRDAVAIYLGQNPESRFFSGKGLILGGSHAPNLNTNHSLVGDLSAILIENINPLVNFVRVPSKQTALMEHFEPKMEAIARETIHANVSNLSGVPSWMLVLIKHILEKTGKQSLEEIWPNLEVFFHGGVAFTPYREQYKDVIRSSKMHYVETYNASEGYFGTQNDPADPAMLLMIDYGIFYEFIPLEDVGKGESAYLLPRGGGAEQKLRHGNLHFCRFVAIYDWRYGEVHIEEPL